MQMWAERRSFPVERERERRPIRVQGAAAPLLFSGALEVSGAPALPLLFESNNKVIKLKLCKM